MTTTRRSRAAGGGRFEVRVDGLTEAKASLDALPDGFRQAAMASIEEGSRVIEAEARQRVPVESGRLRASIGRNVRPDGLQAAVGSGLEYASFIELGTSGKRGGKITPQPWLYPAFQTGARLVRRQMRAWAKEAMQKVRFRTKGKRRVRKGR